VSTGLDFASFYAAARPTLLRTTYAVTGDRQLAEDAVQVAFVSRCDEHCPPPREQHGTNQL
jgi:DNA-directed RNA polymerase specialized sigma24 family protein